MSGDPVRTRACACMRVCVRCRRLQPMTPAAPVRKFHALCPPWPPRLSRIYKFPYVPLGSFTVLSPAFNSLLSLVPMLRSAEAAAEEVAYGSTLPEPHKANAQKACREAKVGQ